MRNFIIILSSVAALSGCASMIDKSIQIVQVETPGVVGADCELETSKNRYRVITPETVQLERSTETLHVLCKKARYYPASLDVESSVHPAHTLINVFNGMIPGTAYDFATRSVYDYPHTISVPMEIDPQAVLDSTDREDAPSEPPKKKEVAEPAARQAPPDPAPAEKTMSHSLRK
jgi:hypothetical protein